MSNPYAATASLPVEQLFDGKKPAVDFAPILTFWERLRIIYNAVLTILVVGYSALFSPLHFVTIPFWAMVTLGAIFANVLFFLGPVAEAYGRCLHFWRPGLSTAVFLVGQLIAAFLAFICVANF